MIEIRRMDRHERQHEFPGASPFQDQCEPLIGSFTVDGKLITLIIDDRGVLFGWGTQNDWHEERMRRLEDSDFVNMLFQFKPEMTNKYFQEILSNYVRQFELR